MSQIKLYYDGEISHTTAGSERRSTRSKRPTSRTPDRAPERLRGMIERTGNVVDDQLLYARLDSGGHPLTRARVRLDLLVEAALPEGTRIRTDMADSIVFVDPSLIEVAIRNLTANASRHASQEGVRVSDSEPQTRICGTINPVMGTPGRIPGTVNMPRLLGSKKTSPP